ncbi:type II toxin-antitoxin system HipA family toxin [Bosea psychrotolerans]|nr:type II toxin-antitoxin system HipA family toxin [Bosea psychrotolerans]
MTIMSHWQAMALAAALSALPLASAAAQDGRRVTVTGEISDTWCTVSGLMFAKGTAHHQCAVWCALGGIPVSIRDAKGELYLILKIGDDEDSAANPRIARMATHEVAVDGELLERDGVKYLLVDRIADDKGVITMTHEEYGIQPFGN